jgi:stage V sporulation protein R
MQGMKGHYTAEDLNELDERCQVIAAEFGLELPEVFFELVQAEDMYDIAARGLPGRYSHYQFGKAYEQMKRDYDTGRSRIYELVINTKPVHAFLLDGNSIISQLLVIAHVYGHAVMDEYNAYFVPSDKNILSRVHSGADRIDSYITRYGRTEVEDFIDSCEALQIHVRDDQLFKQRKSEEPEFTIEDFDELYPEETEKRRDKVLADRQKWRQAFPKQPERDVLGFIEEYAPRLEDWQKDIISIIRTERDYFHPMRRTKVLHEGVATFYHWNIVHQLMNEDDRFDADDFLEFQRMHAGVLQPVLHGEEDDSWPVPIYKIHCDDYNPYLLGHTILEEVKRLCEEPTKEEREKWPWAGNISFQDKRNEMIRSYNDVDLMSEFITPNVCMKAKLFMEPRTREQFKNLYVSEEEADRVSAVLTKKVRTSRIPVVEIVNGDGRAVVSYGLSIAGKRTTRVAWTRSMLMVHASTWPSSGVAQSLCTHA